MTASVPVLPSRAVVDASVAIKWVVAEIDTERALSLQSARLFAPEMFDAECANILWLKVRRRAMRSEDAQKRFDAIRSAPVQRISMREIAREALEIALELDHPAYDCFYLALAQRESVPVVTADQRFMAAARRHPAYAGRILPLADIPLE